MTEVGVILVMDSAVTDSAEGEGIVAEVGVMAITDHRGVGSIMWMTPDLLRLCGELVIPLSDVSTVGR